MRSVAEFYAYLRGRDVALIGPAPHAEDPPAGSIIVRLNIDYRPMHVLYSIAARPGDGGEETLGDVDLARMRACAVDWFVCRHKPGHPRLAEFGPLLDRSGLNWTAVPHEWSRGLRARFGQKPLRHE